MPLSDFDNLLQDLATGFGTIAVMADGQRIEGRFIVDPFDVLQAPAEQGLSVTTTIFYYEPGQQVRRGRWPELHDTLVIEDRRKINGRIAFTKLEYEIVKIDRDDLGEHALHLLQTGMMAAR